MGMAESDPVSRMREDPKGESAGRRDHQSRYSISMNSRHSIVCFQ